MENQFAALDLRLNHFFHVGVTHNIKHDAREEIVNERQEERLVLIYQL